MLLKDLTKSVICGCLLSLFFVSCYKETPVVIVPDFFIDVENEDYAVPVGVHIQNNTSGANQFLWTFEGGNPANSNQKQPGKVIYKIPGTHTIQLVAWNDYHKETKTVEITIDSLAILDFESQIELNAFVPVIVKIENRTKGTNSCEWTFEGGNPVMSLEYQPSIIHYDQPGEYRITLKVISGGKIRELTKTITLLSELNPDFEIQPNFESEDMEVPWKGKIKNKTISGLSYQWKTHGGTFDNDTIANPIIFYDQPGIYKIQMEASNGKQTKIKTSEVEILPNTNLCVLEDIRFGINTANDFDCYYSCRERKSFSKETIDDKNGYLVDFVFFGLNSNFSYCRFLSPDIVQNYVFDAIPGAQRTWIVNIPKENEISLSAKDFNGMKNDLILQKLPIKMYDTKDAYFRSGTAPQIVLFETADGRKGAILIKKFVEVGSNSYIIADIKVQKEKK